MNSLCKHIYQTSCNMWNEKSYANNLFEPIRVAPQRFYHVNQNYYQQPKIVTLVKSQYGQEKSPNRCQTCSKSDHQKMHMLCNTCFTENRCVDCKGIFPSLAYENRCERCDKARRCLRCHQNLSSGHDTVYPGKNFLTASLCSSCESQVHCSICKGIFTSLRSNGRCDRCDKESRCRKCQKELMQWELALGKSDLCKMCKYQEEEIVGLSVSRVYSKFEDTNEFKRGTRLTSSDRSKRLSRYMRQGGCPMIPLRYL